MGADDMTGKPRLSFFRIALRTGLLALSGTGLWLFAQEITPVLNRRWTWWC